MAKDSVISITEQDVLCGRGGLANTWPGNRLFRAMIRENKEIYRELSEHAIRKQLLVSSIIKAIEHHGGRFLRKRRGKWVEISYKEAYNKACQALRDQDNNVCSSSDSSVTSEGRVSPSPQHSEFRMALRKMVQKSSLRTVLLDQDDDNGGGGGDSHTNNNNIIQENSTSADTTKVELKVKAKKKKVDNNDVPDLVQEKPKVAATKNSSSSSKKNTSSYYNHTINNNKKLWDFSQEDFCPLDPHEFIFENVDEFSKLCSKLLDYWSH